MRRANSTTATVTASPSTGTMATIYGYNLSSGATQPRDKNGRWTKLRWTRHTTPMTSRTMNIPRTLYTNPVETMRSSSASPNTSSMGSNRTNSISTRKAFADALYRYGVRGRGFSRATNALYSTLFGKTHKQMIISRKLAPSASLRDHLTTLELSQLEFAEEIVIRRLGSGTFVGNFAVEKLCRTVGRSLAASTRKVLPSSTRKASK